MDESSELAQMREIVELFNNITDRCFQDCVYNFRQKKIEPSEKKVFSLCFWFCPLTVSSVCWVALKSTLRAPSL
jgi:hypothetical protein